MDVERPGLVTRVAISGTGLYTPPDTITNAELVSAYNEFVRRHNATHAAEIAAGKYALAFHFQRRIHR